VQDPGAPSAAAIVGGILGLVSAPVALVLGRREKTGRLRAVSPPGYG
jgi:hypothetical protein